MKKIYSEERMRKLEYLCRKYSDLCCNVEKKEELKGLRRDIQVLCDDLLVMEGVASAELLIALMDAYEITRNEEMLQEVLGVVNRNLERLEVSVDAVKLLAYCYYYVEEEECVVKAREMMEILRMMGDKRLKQAENVLEEFC